MDSRRDFFRALATGGATVTQSLRGLPLKHRRPGVQPNERLYNGPMLIPAHVAECVRESPDLHLSQSAPKPRRNGGTRRSTHLVARYAEDGWTWLFRCRIPDHRGMVGEIVRTPGGAIRVHCWSAARPAAYREPTDIVSSKTAPDAEFTPDPFDPPCVHCGLIALMHDDDACSGHGYEDTL